MSSSTVRDVSVTIGSARDSKFSLWSSSTCPSRFLSSLFIMIAVVRLFAF